MPANRIIEHLDIVKDILASRFPILVVYPLHPFAIEQREKALGNAVVVTVTGATQAGLELKTSQEVSSLPARIQGALVGVDQNILFGPSLQGSHRHLRHMSDTL